MPWFLSICPSPEGLELARVLLLTMRGIPCLFYGSEQCLADHSDGGSDPYTRPMMEKWDHAAWQCAIIRCLA